jgi:hypothetical protein
MKHSLLIVVAAIFAVSTAVAQPGLRDENRRIRRGAISGQLTPAETIRLKQQENALRAEALRFKQNDGRISRRERRKLLRDERRLDRHIFIQKHDRQRRRHF